jgi:succinate dehydrogenase/fumarate reductase flavoprotein subunit
MAREYDVIVVGGGGSGLAAALSAAEHGATVLVLEKQPHLGGTTGIAVGSFTASGTALQRKVGIDDNPDDHEEDAGKFAPPEIEARCNNSLRRFFLEHASETLDWMTGMGLAFHGPSPEPPNRVPRMHNVVPNAKAYVATFQSRLLRHGGTIICDAPVEELITDGTTVTGVAATVNGRRREFLANRGVILAAGDYSNAPEIIARFKGPQFSAIEGINPNAHGDGHILAERAGAKLLNMDVTYGPELRFVPPPGNSFEQLLPSRGIGARLMGMMLPLVPKFVINWMVKRLLLTWQHPENSLFGDGAILVNSEGRRFCNERIWPKRETAIANQPGKICYLLFDQRIAEHYGQWPNFVSTAPEIAYAYVDDYLKLRPDVSVEAPTLDALAEIRGIPKNHLLDTVEQFNRYVESNERDPFGRTGDRNPLNGNRWVLLGPAKAYFTTTEGGVAINERMQVLDEHDQPIEGLYAVGSNGIGGQILWGHGLHIGWAITSGRLVGEMLGKKAAARQNGIDGLTCQIESKISDRHGF